MKKIILSFFFLFVSISFVYAQDFDLGYVDLDFCDGQNQLHIQASGGTQTGFCFTLHNLSSLTGSIKLSLVDGEMSVGEHAVKACKTSTDGFFSKFVTLSGAALVSGENKGSLSGESIYSDIIVLPPHGTILQHGFIQIPTGFVGTLNGCVTFTLHDTLASSGGMFQIINRKANIVDITVTGEYVSMFGFLPMKAYTGEKWQLNQDHIVSSPADIIITHGKYGDKLIIGLQNKGFIDENYTISAHIESKYIPFLNKNFIITSGVLYGQDNVVVEYPLAEKLPFYKGAYTIHLQVDHTTNFIGKDSINTIVPLQQTISFFLYPSWKVLGVFIVIVLFVIGIIFFFVKRKNKKNMYIISNNKADKETQTQIQDETISTSEKSHESKKRAQPSRKKPPLPRR